MRCWLRRSVTHETPGIATALLYALIVLAQLIAHDEPDRSLSLLDEAARVAAQVGDRQAAATAVGLQAFVTVAKRDSRTALRSRPRAPRSISRSVVTPARHGSEGRGDRPRKLNPRRTRGRLIGFTQPRFRTDVAFIFEEPNELEAAAFAHTLEVLGPTRAEELKARGANVALIGGVA